MIQRIQTVYLFLAVVCMIVGLCTAVGHFHQNGVETLSFTNLYLDMADGSGRVWSPWALFVLLVLSAVSSLVAIFLYKKRMLQVRLTVISCLLLIGYYIVFTVFVFIFKDRYASDFTLHWTVGLPAVALILNYLAFRGIMQDELIVRSLDRLR